MKAMNLLTKRLKRRNPFAVTKLPPLCELYLKMIAPPYRTAWERRVSRRIDQFRFRLLMRARDVFYDVGSNWGHYSVFVASRPGFAGRIHAFEAHPDTFRDLEKMVRSLQIERIVECHHFGVSDSDSAASIAFSDGLHSGLATINQLGHGVPIALKTLDSLGLEPPAVIKLDVEGHEAAALRGATKIFREHAPMLVFESWCNFKHPHETLEPFPLLESLGYVFFQPVFLQSTGGVRYALASGHDSGLDSEVEIALVPIATAQRFLFAEYLNVFACPESRIGELEAIFAGT